MNKRVVNEKFFKTWNSEMSYILGYFVADGCLIVDKTRKQPFTFNITSIDKRHLENIKRVMGSTHKISPKTSSNENAGFQLQIRNRNLAEDLVRLGLSSRKTLHLRPIPVPRKYFADFTRGFFDGDGTVYIYNVNGVPQIKVGFISASFSFLDDFNLKLCNFLKIPVKSIHIEYSKIKNRLPRYSISFYIDDCERFYNFIYPSNCSLFLSRKKTIFQKWERIKSKRRQYKKRNYPSKIGWHLNSRSRSLLSVK